MQNRNISDKDILYSMVKREISNILQGIPIFSAFEGTISSVVIQWIDPYISAFIDDDNQINTEQLSAFVSEEMTNKIKNFKERYNRSKGAMNEDKVNF